VRIATLAFPRAIAREIITTGNVLGVGVLIALEDTKTVEARESEGVFGQHTRNRHRDDLERIRQEGERMLIRPYAQRGRGKDRVRAPENMSWKY
jgi:hypothetical protein